MATSRMKKDLDQDCLKVFQKPSIGMLDRTHYNYINDTASNAIPTSLQE